MPRPEYSYFGEEYLLLHEILATLRNHGVEITQSGNDADGNVPYYEFQISTGRLHFGTLVGLLNTPEKFAPPEDNRNPFAYYRNLNLTDKQLDIIKYDPKTVSIAVETLVGNEEVTKDFSGPGAFPMTKTIAITIKGLDALNTKKYLKQYEKERDSKIIFRSTVSTNFWMRFFTGTLAVIGIGTLLMQLYSTTHPTPPPNILIKEKCKKYATDSIYIVNDSLPPLSSGHNKASLKSK
jgi:hypothetical protein